MSIRIVVASRIDSSASRMFKQELRLYRDKVIRGRSFLIAGHRGAGKTSLVMDAVRELKDEALGPEAPQQRRLLPILMHGPSLFLERDVATEDTPEAQGEAKGARGESDGGDPAQGAAAPKPSQDHEGKGGDGEEAPGNDDPLLLTALTEIILSLYRSLADEFSEQYRARAKEKAKGGSRAGADLLERAAQLQMDLDEYPGPERLRDHWSAGDFLRDGVLFRAPIKREPDADQGLRELAALSTACEAYRLVSGTYKQAKEEMKQTVRRSNRIEAGIADGKGLLAPLVSLLSGGIVGGTTFAAGAGAAGLISGVVAALASAMVFRVSSRRDRSRSYVREYTFIPKHDVANLERAVPALIKRVEDAGLVPIFVVDELDKVEPLHSRMRRLVGQLKKLVSERAFFCFLTNRDYYEYLQQLSLTQAYPVEHTYFTDRLFVVFRPDDFHRYLEGVLQPPAAAAAAGPMGDAKAATNPRSGDAGEPRPTKLADASTEGVATALKIAGADREVLPYVLLHRAQMHAIDVRRQIDEIRGPDNLLALAPGSVRTKLADRCDLMVQLGIRMVLERVRSELERDPAFSRLVYDALFYPTRLRRRAGTAELDLSDAQEGAFATDLVRRMVAGTTSAASMTISDIDLKFLYARVRDLAEILADPFELCDAIGRWERESGAKVSGDLRDALPLVLPTGPLLSRDRGADHLYRWGYDHLGRPFNATRRTALGHRFEVEYDLAVRMVMDRDPSTDHEARALTRALLWIPYRHWERNPRAVFDLPGLGESLYQQELGRWLSAAQMETLSLAVGPIAAQKAKLVALLDALADEDTFRGVIVRDGWTARYPRITRELRQPHSPVAVKTGMGYAWQFDLRGAALVANLEVPKTLEQVPWEENVQFIVSVEAALQRATHRTLGLGYLGTGTHVIPTSPEWSVVLATIGRLQEADRKGLGAGEIDPQDIQTVSTFATQLTIHGEAIALAAVCGGIVARAAVGDSEAAVASGGSALPNGVAAVARVLRLAANPAQPVSELLVRVIEESGQRWSDLPDDLTKPPALGPGVVSEWANWISSRLRRIDRTVDFQNEAVQWSWNGWSAHLRHRLDQSTPPPPARSLDDAICEFRQVGPGLILKSDLADMSVGDWSRAFVRACADASRTIPADSRVPRWVAPAALSFLGLGEVAQVFATGTGPSKTAGDGADDEAKLVAEWVGMAARRKRPREHSLLVLAREQSSSEIGGWPVVADVAVLVIDTLDARSLIDADGPLGPEASLAFGHLILEGVDPDDQIAREVASMCEAAAKSSGQTISRSSIGGTSPSGQTAQLRRTSSPAGLLEQLMVAPARPSLHLDALGRDAHKVPEPLRAWLAQPERHASGHLRVDADRGVRGWLARRLLGKRPGVYAASYRGRAEEREGVPRHETLELELREGPLAERITFDERGEGSILHVRSRVFALDFGGEVQRDELRLTSTVFEPARPLVLSVALLAWLGLAWFEPRIEAVVRVQEGGFGIELALMLGRRKKPVVRMTGDFAPALPPDAAALTTQRTMAMPS